MKKVLFFLVFILSITTVKAQNVDIIEFKGRVIDKETSKPIPFANVGVLGSYYGAASDIDGYFMVKIPQRLNNSTVRISAVGYSFYSTTVKELIESKDTVFSLDSKSYKINEIEINAESLVLQRIIKTASDCISKNYIQRPFEYQAYYKCDIINDQELKTRREGVLKIFDNKGYLRSSVDKTFAQINYKFTESRKSTVNRSLKDGFTVVDDLLTFDIVRSPRNILDKYFLGQYELKEEGRFVEKGDSIIIIKYRNKLPSLSSTGDAYADEYYGKIYINLSNYAVIKNELVIKASDYSELGRGFVAGNTPNEIEDLVYKITTTYARNDNYYYLSGISYITEMNLKGKESSMRQAQLIPVKINISNPEKIQGRDYYEDQNYRKEFWERFSLYFEGEV